MVLLEKRNKGGGGNMRIFGTLAWGWNKPYLELSDFAENRNGESLQHMLGAKLVLAAVCPPHPPQ